MKRRSVQTGWVLRQFLDHPGEPQHGYSLMEETRLPSGSVYPILAALTAAGWLTRSTEAETARRDRGGRLRRTLYTLTTEGENHAREYVAALDANQPRSRRIRA